MSLTLGLNTALSGLLTSQRGLDVISQNVVNVNTKGYTRKVMTPESRVLAGQGAGVQEGGVTRMVNEGLLKEIRRQTTNTGRLEVEQEYYPRMDDLFGEVGDSASIAHKINDLFASFQTLSGDPTKPSIQWSAVQSAQDVADLMGSMTSSLQSMRIEADRKIEDTVSQINNLVSNIYDLNKKIVKNSAVSTGTTDLEDKRDQALNDLSKLMDIQYYKRTDNSVTIFSSSGEMLLDNQPMPLSYSASSTTEPWMTAAGGQFGKITLSGGSADFGSTVTGGSLRALLDMRDNIVPGLQANLDETAKQMTSALNQVHNRGTTLPTLSNRYQGTRVFAKQGDFASGVTSTTASFYYGSNTLTSGSYTNVTWGTTAPATEGPTRITITAASGSWPAGLTPSASNPNPVFSVNDTTAANAANNGTYRVISVAGGVMTVERANQRQTMQLANTDDVVLATFSSVGDQLKQTTLNTIMQTNYSGAYTAATVGSGRTLSDFAAKASRGDWSINEVSAHVEGWLRSQGYSTASVNLDSEGKLLVNVGDTTVSLAFRDQSSSTAGGTAADATINFDVDGDGKTDETVKGFSTFFGLNDLYVDNSPSVIQDSNIQSSTYTLGANRDLTLYDTTGKLGNKMTFAKGTSLQQIADTINAQTRTTESAALSTTSWTMTSDASVTVSDPNGTVFSLTLSSGTTYTLDQLAGMMTQSSVTGQVVQDGNSSRLRLSDSRGQPLTVAISGGTIAGSTLPLGQTLEMTQTQRIQASVVPEGAGYRLRIRQTTGDALYSSSTLDVQNTNLLSDIGLQHAATGAAGNMAVRADIKTAPDKISRGTMQWNADTGLYYISEGDNSTALQLASVMNTKTSMNGAGGIAAGKYTFAEYGAATIGVVAQASGNSKDQMTYQSNLNSSLEFQNSSYSGVNLDEEISSMMDYQQAYSAAAKVISTLQDMLTTLTDMIR